MYVLNSLLLRPSKVLVVLTIFYHLSVIRCQSDFETLGPDPVKGEAAPPSQADAAAPGEEAAAAPGEEAEPEGELGSQENENMTELLTDIQNADLKSFASVSRDALLGAWAMAFNNRTDPIAVQSLLDGVNKAGGEERLVILRLLQLMDNEFTSPGTISREEFAALYGPAISTPDQAIQAIFRVYDYDSDGVINIYEKMWTKLTLEGVNQNIFDVFYESTFEMGEMDIDEDKMVNMYEFMLDLVIKIHYGMKGMSTAPAQDAEVKAEEAPTP